MLRMGPSTTATAAKGSAFKKQLASASSDDFLLNQLQDLASDPFAVSLDDAPSSALARKRKRERDNAADADATEQQQDVEDKENQEPTPAPKAKEAPKPAAVVRRHLILFSRAVDTGDKAASSDVRACASSRAVIERVRRSSAHR
jgi:hypothetical protein